MTLYHPPSSSSFIDKKTEKLISNAKKKTNEVDKETRFIQQDDYGNSSFGQKNSDL